MLKKGETIRIAGGKKPEIQTNAFIFEGFIRDRDTWVAQAGDNCAILLREVGIEQLERGMIVTKILADSEQPILN
jgi:translation elongation factor EF-Tu-like GTPase